MCLYTASYIFHINTFASGWTHRHWSYRQAEGHAASDRMVFNWVLWRYTILYINERSWESGGVVRALLTVSLPFAISHKAAFTLGVPVRSSLRSPTGTVGLGKEPMGSLPGNGGGSGTAGSRAFSVKGA